MVLSRHLSPPHSHTVKGVDLCSTTPPPPKKTNKQALSSVGVSYLSFTTGIGGGGGLVSGKIMNDENALSSIGLSYLPCLREVPQCVLVMRRYFFVSCSKTRFVFPHSFHFDLWQIFSLVQNVNCFAQGFFISSFLVFPSHQAVFC